MGCEIETATRLLRPLLPNTHLASRAGRHQERYRRAIGVSQLNRCFVSRHESSVLRGPFTGLTYPPRMAPVLGGLVAKLIGSYDFMVLLRESIRREAPVIVNIGCADGFYAVRLARACPGSIVHGVRRSRQCSRNMHRSLPVATVSRSRAMVA